MHVWMCSLNGNIVLGIWVFLHNPNEKKRKAKQSKWKSMQMSNNVATFSVYAPVISCCSTSAQRTLTSTRWRGRCTGTLSWMPFSILKYMYPCIFSTACKNAQQLFMNCKIEFPTFLMVWLLFQSFGIERKRSNGNFLCFLILRFGSNAFLFVYLNALMHVYISPQIALILLVFDNWQFHIIFWIKSHFFWRFWSIFFCLWFNRPHVFITIGPIDPQKNAIEKFEIEWSVWRNFYRNDGSKSLVRKNDIQQVPLFHHFHYFQNLFVSKAFKALAFAAPLLWRHLI